MTFRKAFLTLALLLAAVPAAHADVRPHALFTDNCVLQRGMKVPVWGWADNGEKVTVRLGGKTAVTEARDGKWQVKIGPFRAGGPHTLTISGKNTVTVRNVLVGEVWIASGQSNMQWPITATESASKIPTLNDPDLRLLYIPRHTNQTPEDNITVPWQAATPETAANFSAVAYFFGRDLRKALGVPVGMIHTSWGGTIAEAWTRKGVLEETPGLESILTNYRTAKRNYRLALLTHQQALEAHRQAVERARAAGQTPPPAPQAPRNPADPGNPNQPAVLYNAMIAPLIPYGIRGGIWYQGESNAGRAWEYQTLFPAMIKNWRQDWGQGDFPFYFVQLAPFMAIQKEPQEAAWPELREAQRLTALRLPNAGQAVITDLGDEKDIHPRKKEEVGGRLALLALRHTYGEEVAADGPTYDRLEIRGDRAIVHFKNAAGGLVAKGGALTGFTIAGADRKFHNATAEIRGNRVVVSSPQVKEPVAVRFGWWNFPVVNLFDAAGLPASPFRTDEFPLTTQPK
jgi:sialate O-acetylesterase